MSLLRTAKEVTRDLIAKVGLNKAHVTIRKFRGENVEHLLCASLSERFTAVYRNRVWLNGRSAGSLSGWGSELENTKSVRAHLAELLNFLDTRSLLDVGCGDFTWMNELSFPFRYSGIDIVQDIIQQNNALYRSEQRSFDVTDATRDPLPQADTILCREVLFHLSFADIRRLVQNVQRCGGVFLIATNDNDLNYNADILSGDFRLLNLHKSPFCFPRAAASIPDDGILPHRTLSAWKLAELPTVE
jgi:2-polyprenyl-3-methyl-5-hydroxy-6-metoxy-1,4-benzoquinol methylase